MLNRPTKILFILKKNEVYSWVSYCRRSSGLWNSTRFIVESLIKFGVNAHIVEVIDNNCIDREVSKFKPDIVVIEALWVTPNKFDVLKKLHPKVKWFCHLHSHMPFLALEGMSIDWIIRYAQKGIRLIANSKPSYEALRAIIKKGELIYLPNVYLSEPKKPKKAHTHDTLHVACLGAIRPLKNQLLQALAAIKYAKDKKQKLKFYINATRVEVGGAPVLKNLIQLFDLEPQAELILLHWMEHDELLDFLHHRIDIGLQVSLSETFNVVTADYITAGLPVVGSKEIYWLDYESKAKDDDLNDIVFEMFRALNCRELITQNQENLLAFSIEAQNKWHEFVLRNE